MNEFLFKTKSGLNFYLNPEAAKGERRKFTDEERAIFSSKEEYGIDRLESEFGYIKNSYRSEDGMASFRKRDIGTEEGAEDNGRK